VIEDGSGDGIAGIGMLYVLKMTDHPEIVLLEGDGVFNGNRTETFYVPREAEYPTSAPVPPTVSPVPTALTIKVNLTIIFDDWHQETSWKIVAENDPSIVFAEAIVDTYRAGDNVTETIFLPPGQSYVFTIQDYFEDGIEGGSYIMVSEDGKILAQGDGNFGAERFHQFTLPTVP